jgi:hypothetical protein
MMRLYLQTRVRQFDPTVEYDALALDDALYAYGVETIASLLSADPTLLRQMVDEVRQDIRHAA